MPNSVYFPQWVRRFLFVIVTLSLTATFLSVSACSGDSEPEEEVVATEPTPTSPPAATPTPEPDPTPSPMTTTTTTPLPAPTPVLSQFEQDERDGIIRSPLNGTAVSEESLTRRILAVKVDNHLEARPQSGFEKADLIFEIWVEGLTRYLAFFQASDVDYLGPIRSMRPTDIALQNPFATSFVNSGGQDWVYELAWSS